MLIIDIKNVEDLIFFDQKLRKKLPDFSQLFQQWSNAKRFSQFKSYGQKAILNFLNNVNDSHIRILENYFNDEIKIGSVDYQVVKSMKVPLEEIENLLCNMEGFTDNYSISRDKDHAYILFWR